MSQIVQRGGGEYQQRNIFSPLDISSISLKYWSFCHSKIFPYLLKYCTHITPLFYNGITEGACDHLSGTHFKNPQAIYSGTRIKKVGLRSRPFFLKAKTSSAEARTWEFWNAILRVSRALPKMKNTSYGLFWFSNEKSAKAMIFWKWRPLGSLQRHTKWPKKDVSGWNFQKPITYP